MNPLPKPGDKKLFDEGGYEIERRPFIVRALAVVIGGVVALAPLVAGAIVFFNPLRKRGGGDGKKLLVTNLQSLPADGKPHRFPVIDERVDAWSVYPGGPIGAVYLVREEGKAKPTAFTVTCPHLGCCVDFQPDQNQFKCPCHNSSWEISGVRINPEHCPSPRDLDTLDVEVEGDDVFVKYNRFRGGVTEKIPE